MVREDKKTTLEQFIKKHYQLIATIGVFGALTALFVRIDTAQDIAVIPFLVFIVLTWELLDSFPDIGLPFKTSMKLMTFEFLTILLLMAVGWFIIVTYVAQYYKIFSLTFLLGLYLVISAKAIEKTRSLERIRKKVKKPEWYGLVRFVLFVSIVGIAMELATLSANCLWSLVPS